MRKALLLVVALLLPWPALAEAEPPRVEQVRTEILDRMSEADKRYEQRFSAQQEAVSAALQSAKEAVASALAAAKEAVTKAEDAANKRFDSVNEFRLQLDDQAKTFMPKAEADIRFVAIEEKVAAVAKRLDEIKAAGEGAGNLWSIIIGVVGIVLVIAAFAVSLRRQQPTAKN